LSNLSPLFPSTDQFYNYNNNNGSVDRNSSGSNVETANNYILPAEIPYFPPTPQLPIPSGQPLNNYNDMYDKYYNQSVDLNVQREITRSRVRNGIMKHRAAELYDLNSGVHKEVVLQTTSKNGGKFNLGFDLLDNSLDKIQSVYIKYHDVSKRKIM
jgi:hypothetical protein